MPRRSGASSVALAIAGAFDLLTLGLALGAPAGGERLAGMLATISKSHAPVGRTRADTTAH